MRCLKLFILVILLLPALYSFAAPINQSKPTILQHLFMIKEFVPDVKVIGVIVQKNSKTNSAFIQKISRAAKSLNLKIVLVEVNQLKEISSRFKYALRNYHINAIWVPEEKGILANRTARSFLIKKSVLNKLMLLAPNKDWVAEGAFLTLVHEGGRMKLIVNQRTAFALDIPVPEKYQKKTQFAIK